MFLVPGFATHREMWNKYRLYTLQMKPGEKFGGTVPIAPFIEALGFPAVLMPMVNFDNNQHEENENLKLENLYEGIVAVAAVLRM